MKISILLSIAILTSCASNQQEPSNTAVRELSEACVSGTVHAAQKMSHGERLIFICR